MVAEVLGLRVDMKGDLEMARKIQIELVAGESFHKNNGWLKGVIQHLANRNKLGPFRPANI